jgi:hypothetical protein
MVSKEILIYSWVISGYLKESTFWGTMQKYLLEMETSLRIGAPPTTLDAESS